ncbi:MAG TPA: glycosyltransferase family 9 protein [Holophagaceae bacterium]|nr:glycosyltransferase family 9 protein [Holophagaceae bacterium]
MWIRFPRQLGDVVFAWPFFAALQRAWNAEAEKVGAKLDWVAVGHDIGAALFAEASPELVSRCILESKGHGKPDPWDLGREWKDRKPVAVINLSHSSRLLFAAWKARIPLRAGIDPSPKLLCHFSIPYRGRRDHLALRFQDLLDLLAPGAHQVMAPMTPELFGGRKGLDTLRTAGWRGGPFATLAFGTRGEPKRWFPEVEKWSTLAKLLRVLDLDVVLLGGPDEAPLGAAIAAQAPGALNLVGRTSIPEACAIQHAAYGNVALDTGLAHTAAATGRPTVCLNMHRPRGPFRGEDINEAHISPVGPHVVTLRPPWMDAADESGESLSGSHRLEPLRVANLLQALAAEARGQAVKPML